MDGVSVPAPCVVWCVAWYPPMHDMMCGSIEWMMRTSIRTNQSIEGSSRPALSNLDRLKALYVDLGA